MRGDGLGGWVDGDVAHLGEVDDETSICGGSAGGAMPATPDSEVQVVFVAVGNCFGDVFI